jgi:DNA polymerase-1
LDLQTNPETRAQWIDYSALDAQATWLLRESLECKLRNMPADASQYIPVDPAFPACKTMWEFYQQHWRPFGALLVQMERNGMLVDNQQLQEAQRLAQQHKETAENTFRSWASARCEDALWMNVGSGSQARAGEPCVRACSVCHP